MHAAWVVNTTGFANVYVCVLDYCTRANIYSCVSASVDECFHLLLDWLFILIDHV